MYWQKKTESWYSTFYKGIQIAVIQADITSEHVDAIVNAANEHLAHGGGVAGAISSRGGRDIQRESDEYVRKNGPVDTGDVGLTGPGHLPCKFVIHAVGPVWHESTKDDELLESAILNSFLKADELELTSISIPAISSGIFGYPKPRCAILMIRTVKKYIDGRNPNATLKVIRLTNFDHETSELMDKELKNFSYDTEKEIVLPEITIKSWNYGYYNSWGGYGNYNSYDKKPEKKVEDKVKVVNAPVSKIVDEQRSEKEKMQDEIKSDTDNKRGIWKRDEAKEDEIKLDADNKRGIWKRDEAKEDEIESDAANKQKVWKRDEVNEDENRNIDGETNKESGRLGDSVRKVEPDENMEVD
ncbi:hypothetical protein SteCoe_29899 [Stentor coeruleus]|uniref:Macro domain-containing protein n=1 Tax=Stentor coeruleus TaxID=5963 RepID=A0A1R2B4X2_9CILI|nr:hypothetical protein SteCoe_29899 [Stentor coeruleus]